MQLQGVYINLSTSTERDAAMRTQLAALGISDSYRRFDAIRGDVSPQRELTSMPPGHLGCWLSHEAVWREAAQSDDTRNVHVLEDDAVLGPLLVQLLQQLPADGADWDLLFTDVYFHPPPTPVQFAHIQQRLKAFDSKSQIQLVDLQHLSFTGTTSYVANRRSLGKLLALTRDQWKSGRTFDVHLQSLVRSGQLKARVTLPFLSTVSAQNVDSTTGAQGPAFLALNAFREALYHAADRRAILQGIAPLEAQLGTEPLLGLYLEVLRRVLGTLDVQP